MAEHVVILKASIESRGNEKATAPDPGQPHPSLTRDHAAQGGVTLGPEHSPLQRRFYQQLTLSTSEYRVSGGELKVSRRVGLPRARRPKPKNGLPLFLAAFSKLACLFYSSCVISSTTLCLLRYFLRTATVMGRKQTGVFVPQRYRIQFHYIFLEYCWTGARLFAFFTGGLRYRVCLPPLVCESDS